MPVALLLIDVLTTFDYPDGEAILENARKIARPLAKLKRRARELGIPVLYVNDNFGDWRSEKEVLIGRCLQATGGSMVRDLLPDSEDYFILKPMHSGFYMTPLEVLLQHLKVSTLILTGMTSNSCITCTAYDANMRNYEVLVPADCSCARDATEHKQALLQLQTMAHASITRSTSLDLDAVIQSAKASL